MKPTCGITSAFWDRIHREYPYDSSWQVLEHQWKNTFYNASGGTQYFWNMILEKFLRNNTPVAFPATFYLGFSSTTPTDPPASNWNVTEPSSGGYARQAITAATGSWAALSNGSTSNSNLINFGTASGTWLSGVNLLDWVLWDALTLGSLHMWADLVVPQPVFNGNPVSCAIGAVVIGGI